MPKRRSAVDASSLCRRLQHDCTGSSFAAAEPPAAAAASGGARTEAGSTASTPTRLCSEMSTSASAFSDRVTASTRCRSSCVAKSALLSSTTSAHSSCSASRVLKRSSPEGCSPGLGAGRQATKSAAKAGLSTTVTMRATWAPWPSSPSSTDFARWGSATPLSSTTTASSGGPAPPRPGRAAGSSGASGRNSSRTLLTRSSEAVQQTQPFDKSRVRAPDLRTAPSSTLASTFTDARSFTSTPRRRP
mmetsp:Transcript_5986/g.18550  ORF Transcript_5986/g.18550 Transcript_5986/m.18550 type:complete len:246 (-) Transcript_5986:90-827(-)